MRVGLENGRLIEISEKKTRTMELLTSAPDQDLALDVIDRRVFVDSAPMGSDDPLHRGSGRFVLSEQRLVGFRVRQWD